jgi:hypothetical protein
MRGPTIIDTQLTFIGRSNVHNIVKFDATGSERGW